MHEKLQNTAKVAISAVAGMGGIGKTELAIKYARQHQADYPGGICWLNARKTSLAAQILQIFPSMNMEVPQKLGGKLLNLAEQVNWCWQNWQPPDGLVLIVLDDVTLENWGNCREFLPKDSRFRVLLTTRWRLDTNFEQISLDVLSLPEALQLLTDLLGKDDRRVQESLQTAERLCAWLGYLPLGLELVGRYLGEDPDLSLAEMLNRLSAQRLQEEAVNPPAEKLQQSEMTAKLGVKAAFELSWQELDSLTQRVGAFLSLFAPDVFVWEWVESESELFNCSESDINEAKKQLLKRHLIQGVKEIKAGYKIHPLIREFLQIKLSELAEAEKFRQSFPARFVKIAKQIPETPTLKDIESVKVAIPHLAEVAQNLIDVVSDEDLMWPFGGLGRFYEGQGLYALQETWYQRCLLVAISRFGERHLNIATSLNNLANIYYYQGRYSESEPLYLQALNLHKRLLGETHPDVATSFNNLAALYNSQGHYNEAEPLYLQALELRKRLFGEAHPDVATSLNNLANHYYYQGLYQEAEPLCMQALEMRKQLLGEAHPSVATSLNNLAALYRSQGRYFEAEPLYLQALEMRKHLLGEAHPDVANSLNSLAGLYEFQGLYSKAEPLYLQALELRKRLLGEAHPDVATSLNNLAGLYDSQGRYSEAEPLYLQALELRKRLLGEAHPDVASSLNDLAGLYNSQGRYSEAEPLYLQALELRKRLLGEAHPHVATSLNNLATLYNNQGRYQEAQPLYLQALEISERLLGANHPNTVKFCKNLAILLSNMKASNSWLQKSLKILLFPPKILLILLRLLLVQLWKSLNKILAFLR